jgi:predicted esterase
MNTRRPITTTIVPAIGLVVVLVGLSGCQPAPSPTRTPLAPLPTATWPPAALPTLSPAGTSAKDFVVSDFDAVHAPVDGDPNKYLIFGNLPLQAPDANLPPELAAFWGRWEGYGYYPPVNKDRKVVLVIQEITAQGGKLAAWSGTNLQFPDRLGEVHFTVVQGASPSLQWQIVGPDGSKETNTFTFDPAKGVLQGWSSFSANNSTFTLGPFELVHDHAFYVYKDYARYLAGKRIFAKTYQNNQLQRYGQGYLLYLPEGYEANPQKSWPLIFFLHGYGDRGDNVFLLAKASPFSYIREKGPLSFIIVAPLLSNYQGYSSFPEAYLDGVLAEIQANYRIDAQRIYMTGLSMGGEATWRYALHQPEMFAAIAPLSAYLDHSDPAAMERIQALPVWAIHGADDPLIPLARAQQPVDALKTAGGNIQFTVLVGHDHDVWTDTYSDPAFYAWLLQHQKNVP